MRVTVTPLRRNGFRLPDRDCKPLEGDFVVGDYWITSTKTRLAATLKRRGEIVFANKPPIAILYDPVLKSWHGSTFCLSGWEMIDWKGEGRQCVIQEWACHIDGF